MTWQPEVNELRERTALAHEMGGPERVGRQHDAGKLTIRERIDLLVDDGTFEEVGSLTGVGEYEDGRLTSFVPTPFVGGLAKIAGRRVVVGGEDFTVRGGSQPMKLDRPKGTFLEQMAKEWRLPLFVFLDGAGANIQHVNDLGHTYLPSSPNVFGPMLEAAREVPVLGAVVGTIAGAVAARAMLCHFTVMTRTTGAMFASGPPVVKRALGHDLTKFELGGADVHVRISGAIDNEAESERAAIEQLRELFSYLPSTVYELPPVTSCDDPIDRAEEALLSIVPRRRTQPYDMKRIIEMVVDYGTYFEIQAQFGTSVVTALARVGGFPCGIVANNPKVMGGALSADGAEKQSHFLELCDHFHIPVVYLADVPGFMIGLQAEQRATLRRGMRAYWVGYNMSVPTFTVVTRKNYGMAGQATGASHKLNYRVAWPSGEWGSIPIEGGVDAAYRREIESAPDPAKRRAELEAELSSLKSPFRTAEAFGIEDLIDPRQTRRYIGRFLEIAYRQLPQDLGLKSKAGVRP